MYTSFFDICIDYAVDIFILHMYIVDKHLQYYTIYTYTTGGMSLYKHIYLHSVSRRVLCSHCIEPQDFHTRHEPFVLVGRYQYAKYIY